ncbi:MAG TPA: hypothetical protein VH518_25255, partial [Tepidisphaeraceae bacterium]
MATLKTRVARLEEQAVGLSATTCPSCHGFGHPRRFIVPFIGSCASDWRFGVKMPVPDARIDPDGLCVLCGAASLRGPVVHMGLPPESEHLSAR